MQNQHDRHTLGGVFSIVSGAAGILLAILLIVLIFVINIIIGPGHSENSYFSLEKETLALFLVMYGVAGLFYFVLGVLGIIGGVFSLHKKYWGVALAGAIAGAITLFPCGIAAIIFISLGKAEFALRKSPELPAPGPGPSPSG